MKLSFKQFAGFLLVLVASASLFVSLYGLMQVWKLRPSVTQNLISGVELISDTVITTGEGLVVIEDALQTTSNNVATLQNASLALAQSTHDASLLAISVAKLSGTDLPQAITATQTSLLAAQASAKVIDNVLSAVSKIPFFPPDVYNPDLPLNAALGQAAASLENLPASLQAVQRRLDLSSSNLGATESSLLAFAQSVKQVQINLSSAQKVVDQYQLDITRFQARLTSLRTSIPRWITTLAWALTFGLIWLGVTQLELLLRGIELANFEDLYHGMQAVLGQGGIGNKKNSE